MRWQKMALLVLRRVGSCVGQNQMCHLCGWLKLFLKNVRLEKIKIQKRWLSGRLSVGSFAQLLYVYCCRSFLLCRLLGLQVTYEACCRARPYLQSKITLSLPGSKAVLANVFIRTCNTFYTKNSYCRHDNRYHPNLLYNYQELNYRIELAKMIPNSRSSLCDKR